VEGVALLGRVRDLLARVDPNALSGDLERNVLLERVLEDEAEGRRVVALVRVVVVARRREGVRSRSPRGGRVARWPSS